MKALKSPTALLGKRQHPSVGSSGGGNAKLSASAFNEGIERLNKFDEKYKSVKERLVKCIKSIEQCQPDKQKSLVKICTELKMVRKEK